MTDKYYDIYFDRDVLKVNRHGALMNRGVLRIIEFEYDDDTDEVTACRLVNENGEVIQNDPDLTDLEHSGDGDDSTIGKALGRFEGWLIDNTVWTELYHATRWEPAEYICIGVEGCVPTADDERSRWWDEGGKESTLYGL